MLFKCLDNKWLIWGLAYNLLRLLSMYEHRFPDLILYSNWVFFLSLRNVDMVEWDKKN